MNRFRTTAVTIVSTIALGSFAVANAPAASAAPRNDAPCATQQTQVDRATTKLAKLTVKFAEHPTKKNKKAKKAQVQRVHKATDRLEKCLAAKAR